MSQLSTRKKFFINFLKNWKQIGSITPSSNFLARKMLRGLDISRANMIVELGPGTGSITKHIVKRMREDCTLILVEINPELKDFLTKCFSAKNIRVIGDTALNLHKYIHNKKVDYVISGIPIACLDKKEKDILFKGIYSILKDRGEYVQFQYSLESKNKIKSYFKKVKLSFTPLSIPPAFIYRCKR